MQLRVLSYNIQHCHPHLQKGIDSIDYELFVDAIRTFDPDIIGLNEVRGDGEHPLYQPQASILAEKLGYYFFFSPAIDIPGHGLYGNAILSKQPFLQTEILPIPDPERVPAKFPYETRCVAKATLPYAGGLTMLTTHFGLNQSEAENASRTVCDAIKQADHPVILTGDFNVTPDNPVLYPIRTLLKDTADVFETPLLSYPSDAPRVKIDYIFTSPSIQTTFANIPPMVVSDHRPYFALLEI